MRKSRFGRVVKADIEVGKGENGVGKMLKRYEEESAQYIETMVREWEIENGDGRDPDETDEEGEDVAKAQAHNVSKGVTGSGPTDVEMNMGDEMPSRPQGLQQSVRVPHVVASAI